MDPSKKESEQASFGWEKNGQKKIGSVFQDVRRYFLSEKEKKEKNGRKLQTWEKNRRDKKAAETAHDSLGTQVKWKYKRKLGRKRPRKYCTIFGLNLKIPT